MNIILTTLFWLAVFVILLALAFDYINGFHDSANAIATVVSTRVLSPATALMMAAVLNFVGAFSSVGVAKTIASGIIDKEAATQVVVAAAIIGGIVWNLITWYYGIPSSSSHALIGGLVGAGVAHAGVSVLEVQGLVKKVLIPIVASPLAGLLVGYLIMLALLWMFRRTAPEKVNRHFRTLQLVSAGSMAFSHGTNDAQKAMGIITLSLFVAGESGSWPWPSMLPAADLHPPMWVVIACATAMALGTAAGGWRIIHTMGSKILRLQPIHGFAAETSASVVLQTAAHMGMPVSTTHVIVASIMGVGATRRLSAVRWGVAGNIVTAWVVTLPAAALIAGLSYWLLTSLFGRL